MDKYEIHIGEYYDLEEKVNKPKQKLIITGEQLEAIETFASKRKDSELNTIYKINDCEFRVYPHFDFKAIWEESAPKPKDWEVVAMAETLDGKRVGFFQFPSTENAIRHPEHPIYAVKRISDGEVFTYDDITSHGTISGFEICGDDMRVKIKESILGGTINLRLLQKHKQPLFKTYNGKDVWENQVVCMLEKHSWTTRPITATEAMIVDCGYYKDREKLGLEFFSNDDVAQEYILMNKRCLSVSQVLKLELAGVATIQTGAERPIAINKSDLIALAKAEQ